MTFLDTLKNDVKRKANFTCCWCRNPTAKVEIHHIIPQLEDGPDTEDNAAPLCGNCHTLYGGNPELRKEIRLRRDWWYGVCETMYQISLPSWIGEKVPTIRFAHVYQPNPERPQTIIQFTDVDMEVKDNLPSLSISFRYDGRAPNPNTDYPKGKWLYITAEI